jgi:ABC-type Fe3+-hydroxamate transport system, periplasmic component
VAFFSIKPDGTVTVRGSEDYIARSIELAGGSYVFESIEGQETNASVSVTMETFYMAAKDADYLVYNSAIEAPVESVSELVSMQPLLSDFNAVNEGNVFCTRKNLYQATNGIGTFIEDLVKMLSGETEGMMFLYKLS